MNGLFELHETLHTHTAKYHTGAFVGAFKGEVVVCECGKVICVRPQNVSITWNVDASVEFDGDKLVLDKVELDSVVRSCPKHVFESLLAHYDIEVV